MKSNFEFLKRYWPALAQIGATAENYVYSDPNACLYKLMNSSDVIRRLDSLALDFFDKYEYLQTMSPSEQLSVLLNHNKEQTRNLLSFTPWRQPI